MRTEVHSYNEILFSKKQEQMSIHIIGIHLKHITVSESSRMQSTRKDRSIDSESTSVAAGAGSGGRDGLQRGRGSITSE